MIPAAEIPHSNRRAALDEQIACVRARVAEMGDLVAAALSAAVGSLVDHDPATARRVVSGDVAINDLNRRVRDLAMATIVRHQPVARDLREVMSLLQMASELERMGDHAVTIARIGASIVGVPWIGVRTDLCAMADLVGAQVRDVMAAVTGDDVEAACQVAARDDRVDDVHDVLITELVETIHGNRETVRPAVQTAFAVHCLERIADRVTNIAEELVFLETGAVVELDRRHPTSDLRP